MVLDDAFWAIDAKFSMEENIKELEQISRRLIEGEDDEEKAEDKDDVDNAQRDYRMAAYLLRVKLSKEPSAYKSRSGQLRNHR